MSIYSILLYADKEGGDAQGVGWQWARREREMSEACAMHELRLGDALYRW